MSSEEEPQTVPEEKIIEEKVYIGNVDYNVSQEELDAFLTGYEVESTEIPKKTTRRKGEVVEVGAGYVFVLFKSVDEAKKAITELNGKELKGRNVYTRVALPDSLRPKKTPNKPAKKAKAKKPKASATPTATAEATTATPVAPAAESEANGSTDAPETSASAPAATEGSASKPKSKKPTKAVRKPRAKTPKVPLSEGVPSKDTIFINNLDFEVTEAALKEFYSEFEPTWVDIPKRIVASNIYRTLKRANVPIRGRGIGFVRFASEEQQKSALEKTNGKEINGRPITVSIAIDSNIRKSEEPVEEPKEESKE